MNNHFSILSLEHHNAMKQIQEDYNNLNLFLNEMEANIHKNGEQEINAYNKSMEIALSLLLNIISIKLKLKINNVKDLSDFELIQSHSYFSKKTTQEKQKLLNLNQKLKEALSFNQKEIKEETNSKIRLIDFCDWYKTTPFNCGGHSAPSCVEEYLKNK